MERRHHPQRADRHPPNKWIAQHLERRGSHSGQVVSSQMWLGSVGHVAGAPGHAIRGAATASAIWRARRVVWAAMAMITMSASIVIALGLFFAPLISSALLGSPATRA